MKKVQQAHSKKLMTLSSEQGKPLFSVHNTVTLCDLDTTPPNYIMDTLSLGPKNAVLDKFNPRDILIELNRFVVYCNKHHINSETITDINVKTVNYIKKCKQMKETKNVQMTKKYLKENDLVAVPYDKGTGICLMKRKTYEQKMEKIIELPQFQKHVPSRSNAKHPVLKEEERIIKVL
ncbi:MAG: hypothetical protein GY694_05465 [Gammaproteobacteria bacterium]|nr:hypothetical protein [Gammaproteobacteria bacterium]